MGAGADKVDTFSVIRKGVDEQLVRLEMAVAEALEVPEQGVVTVTGGQGLARAEQIDGGAQLGQILAAALHPLHVLAEAVGDGGSPHSPSER